MKQTKTKKLIAFLTLGIFLAQPGYGMRVGSLMPATAESSQTTMPFRIELPEKLGRVERLHAGAGPVVIHIQEAHGDPVIQKRIEQILTYLKVHYGIKQVFVEGSAFPCERRLLNFFPDRPKVTRKAAERLMKQGFVSGPEDFLLKNPEVSLSGVEDLQAYNKNSRSFYRVLKQKEKTAGFLKEMDAQMDRLAGAYSNRELRVFLKRVREFDEDRLSLAALLAFLGPQMKHLLKADLEKPASQIEWPMLVRFAALERWQREFDAKKFGQEKKNFLEAVGRFIPTSNPVRDQLARILNAAPAQSRGGTHLEPLIEELVSRLPDDFDYARYPQVIRRIGTVIIQNELQGEPLMDEFDRAIRQLEDHLAENLLERETISLLRDYRVAMKLLKLEWTRREYETVMSRESLVVSKKRDESIGRMTQDSSRATESKETLRPSALVARAIALNGEGRVKDVKFQHVAELEELYRDALEFYRGAEAREAAMTVSVEKQMQASGDSKAVLITGGFHASALEQMFVERNWNYALITPAISAMHGRDSYVESLLQNYVLGPEAKAGLKDIPYATTALPETTLMQRNLAVYLAQTARILTGFGASPQAINRTELMGQLTSGVGIIRAAGGLEIQLIPDQKDSVFIFDAAGQLKKQPNFGAIARWLKASVGNQRSLRSEVRAPDDSLNQPRHIPQAFPLAGGMSELIQKVNLDWENIKREGFFVFDMQKTLVARKAVATPQMIELLAWLLGEGVRVVINTGNTDKEVMDQVIIPLRSFLQSSEKAGLLSRVVVFANSGTLMTEFEPETGEARIHRGYQQQMKLPMTVAETIKDVLQRLSTDKFGLTAVQLNELKKMYALETQKSEGAVTFDLPWMTGGVYEVPIKRFPEEVSGRIQGPYVQLRSLVDGQPTKIAVTKFIPEMREEIIAQIEAGLLEALGPEILAGLDITTGGDSTIDITSVRASKALAIKAYVKLLEDRGVSINPAYIYVHGDELTGAVEGVVTTAVHEGNDLRMLEAFEELIGVAATPKLPVGLGKDAARTYFLGTVQPDGSVTDIEEKGMQVYLERLRSAIAVRSEVRSQGLVGDVVEKTFQRLLEGGAQNRLRSSPTEPSDRRETFRRERSPTWMAKGDAALAWGHSSLQLEKIPKENLREVMGMIRQRVANAPAEVQLRAELILQHLEKTAPEWFDEQRYALDGREISYLIAHAEAEQIAVGRGFFAGEAGFAAAALFLATEESFNKTASARQTRTSVSDVAASLFQGQKDFSEKLEAFIELSDRAFLLSAVARFGHFKPGSPTFRTFDLFKDWSRFQVENDGEIVPYPVTEQAGFLLQKLWPLLTDSEERKTAEMEEAYFNVALPLVAFALYRRQFLRSYETILKNLEKKKETEGQLFFEAVVFYNQVLREAPPTRDVSFPPYSDPTADNDVLNVAMSFVVALSHNAGRDYDPTNSKYGKNRLTEERAKSFWMNWLQKGLRSRSADPKPTPSLLLITSLPQVLTAEAAETFLKDIGSIDALALGNLDWLKREVGFTTANEEEGKAARVFIEGNLLGKSELAYRDFDPIQQWFGHIRVGDLLAFTDNNNAEAFWLGSTEVLEDRVIALTANQEGPALELLTGGGAPVSNWTAPHNLVYYNSTQNGSLSVLVHKNSIISNLLTWLYWNSKTRGFNVQLNDWEEPLSGLWPALVKMRLNLSANPELPETYISPQKGDLSAWADAILERRAIAESIYWRSVFRYRQKENIRPFQTEITPLLELYALFRNPEGLLAQLAKQLVLKPGTARLTEESARAVVDTLAALWWSGTPRQNLADTVFFLILEEFRKRMLFHPDGISISNLEDLENFLTSELSTEPLETRAQDDFEHWSETTTLAELFTRQALREENDEWEFLPHNFLPPEVEPDARGASYAQIRPVSLPSYFDAEAFPAEDFLKPEKWPPWRLFQEPLVVEWVGRYGEGGLQIPGSNFVYRFKPESGVNSGDLIKVFRILEPGADRSGVHMQMVKLPPRAALEAAASKSEVRVGRVPKGADFFSAEAIKTLSFPAMSLRLKNTDRAPEEMARRTEASVPIPQALIEIFLENFTSRVDAADKFLGRLDQRLMYIQAARAVLEHLKALHEGGKILIAPEMRRINEFGEYEYELADPAADEIVLSRELLETPQTLLTQALVFFSALSSHEKFEGGWSLENRVSSMAMMGFLFTEIEGLDPKFKKYLSDGLLLADLDASQALGEAGAEGLLWQKVPQMDKIEIRKLAASPDKVVEMTEPGWMELPGGQNGLFIFDLLAPKDGSIPQRIAVSIPELHAQPVLIYGHPDFGRVDFFKGDGSAFIGTVDKKSGKFKSGSGRVVLLPVRGPLTAKIIPTTTVEYMALLGLEQGLSSLVKTGRTYMRVSYLSPQISAAEGPRVQLDLEHGQIYMDPELVLDGGRARQLVLETLEAHDPLYQVEARTKAILAVDPFSKNPVPDILPHFDESLLALWPDGGVRYEAIYESMVKARRKIMFMRELEEHRTAHPERFPKKQINATNFREWLTAAVDYVDTPNPQAFFFATKQKGGDTQTLVGSQASVLESLTRQEAGVGVTTSAYFVGNSQGRFVLSYDRNRRDPRRYLFIRYPDPNDPNAALLDIFDLESGAAIGNQEIEVRKSRAEYQEAFRRLILRSQQAPTQLDRDKLEEKIKNFSDALHFSAEEIAAFRRARPGELDSLYLINLKIKLLGHLNHIFFSILDSSQFSEAQNFAVMGLVLASLSAGPMMGENFGDETKGAETAGVVARVKKISEVFSRLIASNGLVSDLEAYLGVGEDWQEFQDPEIFDEEIEQLTEDLTERVLAPFARASEAAAPNEPRLENPVFLSGLFEHIFPAIEAQIRMQAEAYLEELNPDQKREGFFPLLDEFLKNSYKSIEFPYRPQMIAQAGLIPTAITPVEHYFIEKIFRRLEAENLERIPEAEKLQPAVPVQAMALGGAAEGIGASSTLFQYKDSRALVDVGIMIDNRNTPPDWSRLKEIPDMVPLTHDHLDHIGATIRFWHFTEKKVHFYATQGSYDLMPWVLGGLRQTEEGKAYSAEDIAEFMTHVHPLETGKWYQSTPDMKMYLHGPVGHLHGAASLLLSTPDSTGFVMGDISHRAQGPVPGWVDIPEEYRTHIDWAVIEATNGMADLKSEEAEEADLLEAIKDRLAIGGKVLLPAFANGRAQRELLLLLQKYALDPDYANLKIYVDGQAAWYTLYYLQAYPEFFKPYQAWMKKNLMILPDPKWDEPVSKQALAQLSTAKEFLPLLPMRTHEEIYAYREEVLERQKHQPTIVIASSGNASQGMSHWWAKHLAVEAENGIYFGGYMDEDEDGGRLLLLARTRSKEPGVPQEFAFKDRVVYVHADIRKFGLSGHIRGLDSIEILETFGPSLKEVTIQHGGPYQRRAIYEWIKKNRRAWKPRLIKSGKSYPSALPRTQEALRDRRAFFESLTALPLPGSTRPALIALPEEDVPPEAHQPPAAAAPPTPHGVSGPVEVVEKPLELEPPTLTVPAAASLPEPESSEIERADTQTLLTQIQTSGSLFNAIGKLTDADLRRLAALGDALPPGSDELVIEETAASPGWRGKLTPAARAKLKKIFQERGLHRSEIRRIMSKEIDMGHTTQEITAVKQAQRQVRQMFTESIFPLGWTPAALRSELRRVAALSDLFFKKTLDRYPQLLRSARRIVAVESKRKIIDQRTDLPTVEEMMPILTLLNARSTLSYVLISGVSAQEAADLRASLDDYLGHPGVRQQWGDIQLDKLAERFRIETVERSQQEGETAMKTAVMAQVLSGKQQGERSAVIVENPSLSAALFYEAERYHFLNLYTTTGAGSTALVWMSAELLDELTDDLLAQFDNQALMKDVRWQGLWSEMQQLLAVRESA